MDYGAFAMAHPGEVAVVPPIPMDRLSDPAEFTWGDGDEPVAPLFTLTAAQEVLRAVQAVQFARRPDLEARRDALLTYAGSDQGLYLRRFIPAELYLERPEAFLPAVGFLWFLNSERTFQMALDEQRHAMMEILDSLLVVADLLSGGRDTTCIFATDPEGRVARRETPIARTRVTELEQPGPNRPGLNERVPVDLNFVTAIRMHNYDYVFDLNDRGNVWNVRGQ